MSLEHREPFAHVSLVHREPFAVNRHRWRSPGPVPEADPGRSRRALRWRRRLALLLLIALPAHAADSFFGSDKALHFGATAAISVGAYAGMGLIKQPLEARLAAAVAFGLMAGVGKELLDVRGLGDPSALDLAWDVIGTVAGAALAYLVDWLIFSRLAPAGSPAR